MHVLTFAAALACASAALAYQPDYFPLNPGNRWVYRQSGALAGNPLVVEVVRGEVIDNRWYALVNGFPTGAAWLRLGEDGTLYAYDPESETDLVWVAFDAPEGAAYSTRITGCNQQARIESRAASWKGGIGEFHNALAVEYPPGECADAGLQSEVYLPWVGLVERTEITIGGPRKYELIYANLGGVTFVSAPELSFSLALDRFVYDGAGVEPPAMLARLSLRNTRLRPFALEFPSGQRYDLLIKDASDNVVYRWSAGRIFPLIFGEMEIGRGELNYVILAPLADRAGRPLPPGAYTAEAMLTNAAPPRFAAAVGFVIRSEP
ncbi:MAG: hypothetical protein KIT09_35535 [Bryobacteraceae bacterium]|nr:hypothetical protein [Bryobacteraceae bacterium]